MQPPGDGRRAQGRIFRDDEYPHQTLTGIIIGAFFEVYHALGYGFLESAYRRALAVELMHRGVVVRQEVGYELFHRGVSIGFYRADLVVNAAGVVEVKTGLKLDNAGPAQVLNYLKVSRLPVGLLLHVGVQPIVKRIVATPEGGRID